jgi:hypothetical protein
VCRRLPVDLIFTDKQLDAIIQASGGHLRDLFTLLRQVVNHILRRSLTPPLGDEHVEEAISLVAHDFLAVTPALHVRQLSNCHASPVSSVTSRTTVSSKRSRLRVYPVGRPHCRPDAHIQCRRRSTRPSRSRTSPVTPIMNLA